MALAAGITAVFPPPGFHNSSIPQSATPIPAAEEEKNWLSLNLPNQTVTRIANERVFGVGADYDKETSFTVDAPDSETWVFSVSEALKMAVILPDDRMAASDHESKTDCTIKYKNVEWRRSDVLTEDLRVGNKNTYNPSSRYYELVLDGVEPFVHCTSVETKNGVAEPPFNTKVLSLVFDSLESAEAARMAIIRHANPDAGREIGAEQDWVAHNIAISPIKYSADDAGGSLLGPSHTDETDTLKASVIDVGYWEFTSEYDSAGQHENVAWSSKETDRCDVEYKKIDWSQVKIERYQPSITVPGYRVTGGPIYQLRTDAKPRAVSCEHILYGAQPAMLLRESILHLLFPTEESARRFAAAMQQHARS